MHSVLLQALLCLLATLVCFGVLFSPRLPWWGTWRTGALLWAVRMAGLLLVFGLLDFPFFMDVPGYLEQAERTLAGEVPNRDFLTPYGVGWVYLNAGMLWLTGSFWGMVFLLQLAEISGIVLITRALPSSVNALCRKRFFWLYVFSPISVNSLCLLTQDDALLILLLGVSVWGVRSGAARTAPWLSAAGFHLTKLFSVWILFPIVAGFKLSTQLWCGLTLAASCAGLWLMGIQPLAFSFSRVGGAEDVLVQRLTNGNPWFLLSILVELPASLPKIVALLSLAVAAGGIWIRGVQLRSVLEQRFSPLQSADSHKNDEMQGVTPFVLWGCSLLVLTFQFTYQMSYPMYLAPALPGLIWLGLREPKRIWMAAFLGLNVLSPWLNPAYFRFFVKGEGGSVFRAGFLLLDAVQVGCVAVLLVGLIRSAVSSVPWQEGNQPG